MIRNEIIKIIKKAAPVSIKEEDIKIEQPGLEINGEYSSNIAFQLVGALKTSPQEIADNLKLEIEKNPEFKKFFEKVEVKNGFLNFFLCQKMLSKTIDEILKNKFCKFPKSKNKINLEFISANPTGKLHIGNGRGAFYGDVLGNIFKKLGYQVEKEFYINDSENSNQIKELGKTAVGEGSSYLTGYLKEKIKENSKEIKKIAENIKDSENPYGGVGHFLGSEVQKDTQNFIEKKLKIKFDRWTSENNILKKYKSKTSKIIKDLEKRNLIYEKDGAMWLKTSEFGEDRDWVIIRQDGFPAYLFSDLIYHYDKMQRNIDFIVDVLGADHQAHEKKMEATMKILNYQGNFKVFITQMVNLQGGKKLSKRMGNTIELEELVDLVGLDVARYFYLVKSLNTQMEFDLDLAKEQSQKNPVFYIQYAYARISSILKSTKVPLKFSLSKFDLLKNKEETKLIKYLLRFPEILEDIGMDYQVHKLITYTFNLASLSHRFYQECHVLTDDKDLTEARLALITAVKIVLGESLDLLGISKPEKM